MGGIASFRKLSGRFVVDRKALLSEVEHCRVLRNLLVFPL